MKKYLLYLMAVLYVLAGVNHFIHPETYEKIMPPWLNWHYQLILISGVAEALLGVLLFPVVTRRVAAWGIIALLVAVFPANIQMTINYFKTDHPLKWLTIIRLPLQGLLIWWAYLYTKPNSKAA